MTMGVILPSASDTGSEGIIETVGINDFAGENTSLSLDSSGCPHFSYYDNTPPYPPQIDGPINCNITEKNDYYITISDPDGPNGDRLMELHVFFGDDTNRSIKHHDTGCTKGWRSGTILTVAHRWKKPNNYTLKARVMDYAREWSDWGYLDVHVQQNPALTLNSISQQYLELLQFRFSRLIPFLS
jgi:hypothetical protein